MVITTIEEEVEVVDMTTIEHPIIEEEEVAMVVVAETTIREKKMITLRIMTMTTMKSVRKEVEGLEGVHVEVVHMVDLVQEAEVLEVTAMVITEDMLEIDASVKEEVMVAEVMVAEAMTRIREEEMKLVIINIMIKEDLGEEAEQDEKIQQEEINPDIR